MFLVYGFIIVIVAAWAIKSISNSKIFFRHTIFDIPLLLFLLSQVLSTIFSMDVHTSIWGYYSRGNGGLLSTISFLFLYWAYVSNLTKSDTYRAIRFLLVSAVIVSIWGVLEHFGASFSCVLIRSDIMAFNTTCWVQDVQNRVFATLGQPNWLAAWIVAIAPLAWLALGNKANETGNKLLKADRQTLLYILVTIATFAVVIFTKSRSGFLGLIIAYILFWGSYLLIIKKLKLFVLVTCGLLLVTIVFGTPWTPSLLEQSAKSTEQSFQTGGTSLENGGTESGDIRKIVWTGALNIWRANPIIGTGVETFGYSYYKYRPIEHNNTSEWELLYNKAHNEYLNYLANTGIFGLGTYLLLISTVVFYILRNFQFSIFNFKIKYKNKNLNSHSLILIAILAGYVSILVTNFFGFSVVIVQLLFFLYPAMAVTISLPEQSEKNKVIRNFNIKSKLMILFALCSMFYLLFRVFQIWNADILYTSSTSLARKGLDPQAFISIQQAIGLRPDEPLYYDQLAKVSSTLAVKQFETNESTESTKFLDLAKDASFLAISISPSNLNILKSQAVIYQKLALADPTNLNGAVKPLEQAVALAPTDPKVRYNLGQIYYRLGRTEDAKKVFEETLLLKSDYYDARVGLGAVYTKLNDKAKAQEQYQWILDHLNPNDEKVKDILKELKF